MAEIGKPPPVRAVGLRPTLRARMPLVRSIARIRPGSRARFGIFCVAAAALLFPLVHHNDADVDSMANALSFAALALGLNIVVGFAGLLDLGYAAFFAIGAYAYGILSSWQLQPEWTNFWEPFQWLGLVARNHTTAGDFVHFQVSFWLMLPGSAAIAAFCGVLFGAPTLRLKGDYLAIVTLGFGEIVPIVVRNWPSLTNGAMGLNGVAPPQLFGFDFGVSATPYYYVGVALVALLIVMSQRLKDSRIGRAWMAIRDMDVAAEIIGIRPLRTKLLAFALSSFYCGIAGAMWAFIYTSAVEASAFEIDRSFQILFMIIIGGLGSILGSFLGAGFIVLLPIFLDNAPRLAGLELPVNLVTNLQTMIFGALIVFFLIIEPNGLARLWVIGKEKLRLWPFPH